MIDQRRFCFIESSDLINLDLQNVSCCTVLCACQSFHWPVCDRSCVLIGYKYADERVNINSNCTQWFQLWKKETKWLSGSHKVLLNEAREKVSTIKKIVGYELNLKFDFWTDTLQQPATWLAERHSRFNRTALRLVWKLPLISQKITAQWMNLSFSCYEHEITRCSRRDW